MAPGRADLREALEERAGEADAWEELLEIYERRARFTKPLVVLKRAIWKLLKFYTYRLWSQQNQVNGLLGNMGGSYQEEGSIIQCDTMDISRVCRIL